MSADPAKPTAPQFGRVPFDAIAGGLLARLTGADVKVYAALCAHANQDWIAGLGLRRIAELTGLQVGSVSRCIERLVEAHAIQKQWSGNGARATYRIATERHEVKRLVSSGG